MSITAFHNLATQEYSNILPMSTTQEGLWFLDQLGSNSAINTLTATIHVSKLLNPELLAACLRILMHRHEALRATFHVREGQPVQVIHPTLAVPLTVFDLQALPEAQQQADIQRLTAEQAQQPFALTQAPLLRCSVLLLRERSLLLLNLHRIICDQWSLSVFARDLAHLYDISASGQPSSLLPQPPSYTQVLAQQREEITEETLAEHLSYWKQQLVGAPAVVDLPTDRVRSARASSIGAISQVVLPGSLNRALQQLGQQQQVSLNTILIGAFSTLLARYSGQEDLVLGTIMPERRPAETQAVIGSWENLLPLHIDLSGITSFLQLLQRIKALEQAARAHENLPFETLLKNLHPSRPLNHSPLIQVLLRLPCPSMALPAQWTLEPIQIGSGTSQFDLTLELHEHAEGLLCRFIYRSDLFEEATIKRLVGHWQVLLAAIVADPQQAVSRLPLLTLAERSQLLVEWTANRQPYPLDRTFAVLFEAQVQRTPEAIAVICEGEQLSYYELNRRANQLAHSLLLLGVGPEVLVALLSERSIALLVAILAVFKAGGAYLPLDPHHPAKRLQLVIEQSRCQLVLSAAAFADTLAQAISPIPDDLTPRTLTFEQASKGQLLDSSLPASSTPSSLAYVIYTSGSTGKPKGAMVEQRGMLNHLFAKIDALALSAADTVAQTASQCFDISVWQFLAALLVGGRVHIYPDSIAHDATQLLACVEQQQVSILETVPSLLRALLDAQEMQSFSPLSLSTLRWLIPTGEELPTDLCRRWLTRYPHVPLLNAYGPTECSDDVTHYVITQPPGPEQSRIPIGTAIPNMRLYVLDRSLEPLPIGISGELYVGGIGVGRGYRYDEQRTHDAFVPDPFSDEAGARLYKTGDRARYLADGNLEFLGRLDFQVKLRGLRIELGEIEAVLSQHPAVRQTVVLVDEQEGTQRLLAYVVLQPSLEQEPDAIIEEVKRHLIQQLPAYMVPTVWMRLEEFPLTPNGKLDRKSLPVPQQGSRDSQKGYVAPILPIHQQLVEIWEAMLGVQPIGINDDFFELGGDSLLAARLFERMRQISGKQLSLAVLFAGATIEQVAKALQTSAEKVAVPETRTPLVAVQTGGTRRPFFFLHGEWEGGALYTREVARQLGPEQPFYLLEPYRFEGLAVPPTFEEMAAAHLAVLLRVQPEGPYLLGGYCNGALMAYEMARQLHVQGQAVDLLLLIDPDAPARHRWVRKTINHLCNVMRISQKKQFESFLCLQHIYRYLRFSHYRQSKNFELISGVEQGEVGHKPGVIASTSASLNLMYKALLPKVEALRQKALNVYDWPASDYAPELYAGKITFFWTSEEPWRSVGWQHVVKAKGEEVELYMLPGNHITSRTEYLPVLAEHVRKCLNKVQVKNSSHRTGAAGVNAQAGS